ncbi:MAG: HAD family hydrolase [Candidatus Nanopelagicales bacterium]
MPLAAVLFDMDGLLIDTEPVWMKAEVELVTQLGGTWTPEDQAANMGISLPAAAQYIKERVDTEWAPEAIAVELVDRFLAHLAQGEIVIQPGTVSLVGSVADAGLPYALVSASERRIVDYATRALYRAGVPEFPLTIAGDEVIHGKPHPEPYLKAARELGVDIRACVVLEDSLHGVAAAHAAGAQVIAMAHMIDHQAGERIVVRRTLEGLTVADLRALVER